MKQPKPVESGLSKKILIVDDDHNIRLLLEKTLISLHHTPVCASSAKEAQQIIESSEVDLVISDIQMPEMTGVQLLHWINKTHPMPVILMTGAYSNMIEAREAAELESAHFLAKPFKRQDLINAINSCFPIS